MHKVFVYGSLLSGMGNHRLLSDSKMLGISHSPTGFGLIDLGYFPGAIRANDDKRIIGEVYEIDDATLSRLDRLEGYNANRPEHGLYNRIEIMTKFGPAYMYIYNHGSIRMTSDVTNGDWRTYYNDKITKRL